MVRLDVTIIGKYLSSTVKQIFHKCQLTRDGGRKFYEGVMSTSPLGTRFIGSLAEAAIY